MRRCDVHFLCAQVRELERQLAAAKQQQRASASGSELEQLVASLREELEDARSEAEDLQRRSARNMVSVRLSCGVPLRDASRQQMYSGPCGTDSFTSVPHSDAVCWQR
eukprot:2640999-Rhodomonas_salina.1